MTPREFQLKLEKFKTDVVKYADNEAPRILANTARRFFKEGFQKEGFVNGGLQPWQEVKRRTNPKTKGADKSRKILTGSTAALGRSIMAKPSKRTALIYSNLPYAAAHNEGANNAGRSHSVHIPQRQFIGDSAELDALIISEIQRKLNSLK